MFDPITTRPTHSVFCSCIFRLNAHFSTSISRLQMAHFTNPEREGRDHGKKNTTLANRERAAVKEIMSAPSGFGAPRSVHVSEHGPLFSGWTPNPERTVTSPPWLQVDCCSRWPAHNESYINGLCGHRIHEGCLLTIQSPNSIDACPICVGHATYYEREG